ncbi:hypothetical protein BDV34DRAFT_210439 [Aspergillus parasiticus]|uniref:Xylanolytic transcriptional activator regulatory domain-containing protein n=1 Tax=Aspergillus parasiticus TaxID=5067 RepID=A0A5N6DWB1_ASPPA|nr:hypothetical protein BDV34DRAFT_210439 [Aspergillus parasiticus]
MSLFMPTSNTTNTGIKIVTLSQAQGLTAVINIFSPEGRLLGLLSATEVTAFRTALAVMTLLVRCNSLKKENIVIFGSGRQAEWHARLALLLVPDQVRSITLINRGRKRLDEMKDIIAELQSAHPGVTFTTLAKEDTPNYQEQLQAALAACDIIFSCTPSTEPNFPYSYLQPFKQRFISLIGSYRPHMKEIDTKTLLSGGNQIYVDSKEACLEESGELIDAHVKEDQLIEIGEMYAKLGKSEPIPVSDTHNVVFKCVGMGIMDLTIGKTLLDLGKEQGLGMEYSKDANPLCIYGVDKRDGNIYFVQFGYLLMRGGVMNGENYVTKLTWSTNTSWTRSAETTPRLRRKPQTSRSSVSSCRTCLRYRRQCVFTHPDHAEKVARSSSISLLERNAGLSRQNLVDSERIRYMERILQHYVPNISFDIQSLRKTAEELKHRHRHSFTDASPSVRLDEEDFEDLAIDDEDYMVKALPDNTTQYSGEFSYLNLSMKIRQKIDEWMKTAAPEASTETDPFEERWRATQLQSGSSLVSASVTCLPPRFVADFLVQIFFKYAQTNNFYVEEDWIREKLNICYTNPSSLSSNDAGSVCSILMVLAVGTQFAHMESAIPVNRPPVDLSSMEDHHFSEDEVGLTFYQFASKLVPDILATVSIRSVQACLLIGTYLLPLDTSGLCYTYFGLALKMAIQNGMHRRYQGEGLSPRMIEVRNRVFWTAYTIEKRVSILHGRPVSLSDSDVDAAMPVDFPGLNLTGQVSNHTNMVTLITLTLKLGEVANEMGQQQDCLERLLNLRKNLVDWWATLPEETNCRDLNPSGPLFRSNVHLKLDYCLTRIFLGRPFLFSNMKILSAATPQAPPFKTPSGVSKNRSTLITDCVEAALEIINLCQLLRDESGLARASFTEFSSCRAALLVILAQSLTKRTERLREALEKGMVLIKIMSMGVGSARSAVSVIETLERAIRRLEDWSERQAPDNPASMESAYDRFKNWEMLWKTGPMSPELVPFQEQYPAGRSSIPPVPVTPMTGTSGGNDPMEGDVANTEITTLSDYSTSHAASLPPMPRFGFDHFVSNFPQELDEFTAIPCFEPDAQQNLSSDINNPDTKWMQFTSD